MLQFIIILLIVIFAITGGLWLYYAKFSFGSDGNSYAVAINIETDFKILTGIQGAPNNYQNGSLLEILVGKRDDTGSADNIASNGIINISIGDFGFPQSYDVAAGKIGHRIFDDDLGHEIWLYGESIGSVGVKNRPIKISFVLAGTTNGLKDFDQEKLKKFPKISIHYTTPNEIGQDILFSWKTLSNDVKTKYEFVEPRKVDTTDPPAIDAFINFSN